jgi:Predicted membrane protein (DUF2127)
VAASAYRRRVALGLVASESLGGIRARTWLWLHQRWSEYFAPVPTSVLLPYEVYHLTAKVTWLRIAAFVINLLLVIYLVWTKRLFGVRGGKEAYEARLRTEWSSRRSRPRSPRHRPVSPVMALPPAQRYGSRGAG